MKKFLIDLSDVKVNPITEELCYKVGDVFTYVEDDLFFGEFKIEKRVIKITYNTYHKCEFVFIKNNEFESFNGLHDTYEQMIEDEIQRLMENPNA